ncbi:glycoside hydrolase family 18 protein [Catellatospora sp. KI3]|uniref:glycoside hydrolase family 18 protein n=1 Tax=Catellatospora sp. KI3 TaxID=3041620 RepID=UPI002482F51E|nr:glycoside hydrolase family 18 protein [Catellatospora sp. KI3]MDI1460467.1 glycoside hydrolase family 18 protein [Catellatospora sp. KI3]
MFRTLHRPGLVGALALTLGAGLMAAVPAQAAGTTAADKAPKKVISAYFADWDVYGRGYFVKDIPADKLNVIQYAFGVPTFDQATGAVGCGVLDPWADFQQVYWGPENTVDGVADSYPDQRLYGNFNQLRKLKAANPHLKIEISLGGWTKSTWFSSVAATAERRQAFVAACIDTFIKGNLPTGGWPENAGGIGAAAGIFDGIDLDWEYPTQKADSNVDYGPADRRNATLLAQEFRRQLDAQGAADGKHYLLTAALPAAKSSTKYYELREFAKSMDWVNIMTYDFNVPGGSVAGPSTLFGRDPRDPNADDLTWNTTGTVAWYLLNGVPANKIVVGVPFYGVQYVRNPGGLYGPFDNAGLDPEAANWDAKPQPSYHDLVDVAGVLTADGVGQGGYTRKWNVFAGEPYLVNPAAVHTLAGQSVTAPTTIVYSDPKSIGERTALIKLLGLRGAMAWELSQDSNDHALISALGPVLN